MKRNFYTLLTATLLSLAPVSAQEYKFNKGNAREGESVEYCITHKKMAELRKDPKMAALIDAANSATENQLKSKGDNSTTKATLYKIPIVFHVIENGGDENITRDQILDAVSILNRDFRRQNADAANVQTPFQGMPTDVEIEFVLASKDPVGNCFSGITRTKSAQTVAVPTQWSNGGLQQVNAVVSGNDVYQGVWPHTKYLNVYIAKSLGGNAAGYTFNPMGGAAANVDGMYYNGIFMMHSYVGSIGTSTVTNSRALTHEVGHWLNLSHTWGDNNDPGNACGDDGVSDTPITKGYTSCPAPTAAYICNSAIMENYENYMDYSYCSKMFTPGQVTRMRAAIVSSTAGRNQLTTAANHTATGISLTPSLCKADFMSNKKVICAGESIQFTDQTYNAATGWTWTFTGGTPATSSSQNPTITYNTPGTYAVKLVATDGTSSNTKELSGYITVLQSDLGIPFFEGFESLTNLSAPRWFVENSGGNAWTIANNSGATGSKSAKVSNINQPVSNEDELISGSFDLSSVTSATGLTLTMKYAYRKIVASNSDKLQIYTSRDCGETWSLRKTFSSGAMSGTSLVTSNWTAASSDYLTFHLTTIPSSDWTENFRFKFRFTSGGGNNVFIDDINLYAGPQSDIPVLGLDELEDIQGISLYPNPAEDDLQLVFNSKTGDNAVQVVVSDLFGKTVQSHFIQANEGSNVVVMTTEDLSAGTYMVRLATSSGQQTLRFIKK